MGAHPRAEPTQRVGEGRSVASGGSRVNARFIAEAARHTASVISSGDGGSQPTEPSLEGPPAPHRDEASSVRNPWGWTGSVAPGHRYSSCYLVLSKETR